MCRFGFANFGANAHELPFDRSSLTCWRQSGWVWSRSPRCCKRGLSVAHRSGAIETNDLERVVADTTVQEKAIAHPTPISAQGQRHCTDGWQRQWHDKFRRHNQQRRLDCGAGRGPDKFLDM
jgi:hypothetical protein